MSTAGRRRDALNRIAELRRNLRDATGLTRVPTWTMSSDGSSPTTTTTARNIGHSTVDQGSLPHTAGAQPNGSPSLSCSRFTRR